ncbi:hypothetical protein M422DRAFT_104847, partial [Sphaerobolus stellatus SS14]
LQLHEETKEPFLRLPPPHSNIILTPPRVNDEEISAIVSILNVEKVTKWLQGPPFPYKPEHAKYWLEENKQSTDAIIKEIESKEPGYFIGGCPVRILREITEDGREIFLGDCGIDAWGFEEIADQEERKRLVEENSKKEPGDPDKEWSFGDYLAPSHHGKGIMSLTIKTLLDQWIIPRMGAKKINATAFNGNIGSVRVFEKNGFVLEKTL